MEGKKLKTIYFLYTQKGQENNIQKIEINDKIKKVEEISEELCGNYIQILYKVEVLINKDENKINISLLHFIGDSYLANIYLNQTELDKSINNNDIIIFKVSFKPYLYDEGDNLYQIFLPYEKQFDIFEKTFINQENILINLYSSVISQVFMNSKTKFEFIINLFLKIYDEKKYMEYPKMINVLKYFFKNIINILRNCEVIEALTIPKEKLNILSDTEIIRTKLIKIIGEKEDNIDIFLAFYYIHYQKKLFINFINDPKYKDKINKTLNANRNIFSNFTNEILTPELMEKAENGDELLSLMRLYPNIVECFKILTDYMVYCKFASFKIIEKKGINIMNIQKPKKNDNMDLLNKYFKRCYEFFGREKVYPLIIHEDFFINYYKIFIEKDEDFHKNIIIIDMLKLYNSKAIQKINSDEVLKLHMEKGLLLMKEKKLKNIDLIYFLNYVDDLSRNNEEIVKYFPNGIDFSENDKEFINDILSIDKYNLKKKLGKSYPIVFEKIFERFITPKDLLILSNWNINENTSRIILDIFLNTIKRIWLNYPDNYMHGLSALIAKELSMASNKIDNYRSTIDELEEKIDKEKLMAIYSEILFNDLRANNEFIFHIRKYIKSYDKLTPIYLWYLTSTFPDEYNRIKTLKKYLELNSGNFEVRYSDFVNYPNKIEERLLLFTNLKNKKIIQNYFEDSDYYKHSINSKKYLKKNIFKDGIKMQSNIQKIQDLLIQFFLEKNESIDELVSIMINFNDSIEQAKEYYNSLELIQKFWKIFYPKTKNDDLIKLKDRINKYEITNIEDCLNESELDNKNFTDTLNEAEKGIKLNGSIIFMEIYKSLNKIKDSEIENYNLSLEKFSKLEKLGENCDIDILDGDIKKCVVDAVYKNIDLLNEELNFIENYFKFGKNNNKNNYDIKRFRNQIISLVKIQQKELGDYKINIDEKFKQDIEEDEEDDLKEEEDNDRNTIKTISRDSLTNSKSSSLDLKKGTSSENKKICLEERLNIKNEIKYLSDIFFYKLNILDNSKPEEFEELNESFSKIYIKLFKIGMGFGKLSLKDIYEGIIPLSNKIYCLAKNSGIVNNIQSHKFIGELILIYEFNYFIQLLEKYKKIDKKTYVNIFITFNKLYNNDHIDNNFVEDDINKLLDITTNNIINNSNYIFIEILLNEYKKNQDIKVIKYIFRNKFDYLYGDMLQIIDQIFNEEIHKKLKYQINCSDFNNLEFNSSEFQLVNEACNQNEDLAETILYYFESKIMSEMNKNNKNEKEIFNDGDIKEFLRCCIEFLESEFNQRNDKILSILFSIAFTKCFLNRIIKFSYNDVDSVQDNYLFDIILKLGQIALKPFRTTLKLYIIKLIFFYCGNLSDFSLYDLKQYYIRDGEIYQNIFKNYGFDFMFTPLKLNIKDEIYNSIMSKLYNKTYVEIIEDNEINEAIKNNLDLFFCVSTNFLFSYFYSKDILDNKEENQMNKWISEKIINNEIECIQKNKEIRKIFCYFINLDGKNQVYKEFNTFKYDQILCLLISARFILSTILSTNKDSLYYNLLFDAKIIINNHIAIFNEFYFKEFDKNITDKRKLSCLAYKLVNYIFLSHIYFGLKIELLKIEDINKIFAINNLQNKNEKYISDYILENLFKEFYFIQKILLPLLGINNIIIFIDSFYKELYPKILDIKLNDTNELINNIDEIFDKTVNNTISNYVNSVNDYYKYENVSKNNAMVKSQADNNIMDILLEKPKFYNDKKKLDKEYPLLSYFTYTNFSVLNDDFRNQYIYYFIGSTDCPFINSILLSDNIFNIINYIPKLNKFSNQVYDKINMRYTKEEIKSKKIKEVFNSELIQEINEFNDFIENNKELFDVSKKIDNDQNIYEIINIPGSRINYVYMKIIEIYNNFLKKMKYCNNNKLMDEIIIQEAKENDYNFNYILNIEENDKMTIKQKLDELILLYSKRERKSNNYINVYNGGKIIYNFEIIENKLEEQFILGKKYFSQKQKLFIFSEEIFEQESNILKEFEKNFAQNKKNKEDLEKMEEYINKINKENNPNLLNLFYELYFIFKYLTYNTNDIKINKDEKSINDLVKYLELKSYKLPEIKEAKNSLNYCLSLNNILHFYQIVLEKAFNYLTTEIKEKLMKIDIDIKEENIINIKENLASNVIITSDVLISAMKKYILKYVKNKDRYIFGIKNLIDNKDIWNIHLNEKFYVEFNKLFSIDNDEKNSVIKYCYMMIYNIKINPDNDSKNFNTSINTSIYCDKTLDEQDLLE